MANIGTFTTLNDGFTGTLHTLTLKAKIAFVPNDKSTANAPDYRILSSGGVEIRAAWASPHGSSTSRPCPSPPPAHWNFRIRPSSTRHAI
nr:DUF736 domain-containing protein [Stutzerimonas stutzeri]